MGLIDSHAHLTSPKLLAELDAVLARCDEVGVDEIVTIGMNLEDSADAVGLAGRYPGRIYATSGIHPHEAGRVSESDIAGVAAFWGHPGVVAVGEIGLDYHYDFADRAVQRAVFSRQLELAVSKSLPLVIHCREAFDDVIALLCDCGFEGRPVVFHCFSSGPEEAGRLEQHGWRLSFTGVVTFPKSTDIQEVARTYPADRLMLETDAPYLSPVPLRGKPNEPAHLVHTARFLAELRGESYEEVVEATSRNTSDFFALSR